MQKLTGVKKKNIAVFISGTGSNLENLIKCSLKKNAKFKIRLIIANNSEANGLRYAKKYKINKRIINYSITKIAEKNILNELKKKILN